MVQQAVAQIIERDLLKLKEELLLYTNEEVVWHTAKGISNSAGNLCLHLIGNLNHFIGATLGGTGYVRNRPAEFETKYVPRETLLKEIDNTLAIVKNTMQQVTDEELQKEFPLELAGKKYLTGFFLLHLTTHLSYHLGQINYHRRLLAAA
ncbi:MAG: DUF1572 family protein [Chitinophagales bacterium]|nr:DUF1572 family protein [Chitinophagales bacterium]